MTGARRADCSLAGLAVCGGGRRAERGVNLVMGRGTTLRRNLTAGVYLGRLVLRVFSGARLNRVLWAQWQKGVGEQWWGWDRPHLISQPTPTAKGFLRSGTQLGTALVARGNAGRERSKCWFGEADTRIGGGARDGVGHLAEDNPIGGEGLCAVELSL